MDYINQRLAEIGSRNTNIDMTREENNQQIYLELEQLTNYLLDGQLNKFSELFSIVLEAKALYKNYIEKNDALFEVVFIKKSISSEEELQQRIAVSLRNSLFLVQL